MRLQDLLFVLLGASKAIGGTVEASWGDLQSDNGGDSGIPVRNNSFAATNLSIPFNPNTRPPGIQIAPLLDNPTTNPGDFLIFTWLSFILNAWVAQYVRILPDSVKFYTDAKYHGQFPTTLILDGTLGGGRSARGNRWDVPVVTWGMLDALPRIFDVRTDTPGPRGSVKPVWRIPRYLVAITREPQGILQLGLVYAATTMTKGISSGVEGNWTVAGTEEGGGNSTDAAVLDHEQKSGDDEAGDDDATSAALKNLTATLTTPANGAMSSVLDQISLDTSFGADLMPQKVILMLLAKIITDSLVYTAEQEIIHVKPQLGRIARVALESPGWEAELYICHDRKGLPLSFATVMELVRRSLIKPMQRKEWSATDVTFTDSDFPLGFGLLRWGRLRTGEELARPPKICDQRAEQEVFQRGKR